MALDRPTLQQLYSRIEGDILSRVTVGWGILRRSFIKVMARVFAAAIHLTYGFLDFLSTSIFATTAEGSYLDEHGAVWGLARLPATFAVGSITPTGTPGTNIPMGTVWKNADGVEYTTDALLVLPGSVDVTASTAGVNGNQDAGDILTIDTPIAGVDDQAPVDTGGLTGGGDVESDDHYRARILERIQYTPQGGSYTDYEGWVLNYQGAFSPDRVWIFPAQGGPGTVQIYFMLASQVFPNATQISAIQDEIDKRAPVTAIPSVDKPTQREVGIEMELSPNTSAVQDAVKASLVAYFEDNADVSMTLLKSQLDEAISLATGEVDHVITDIEVESVSVGVGNISFGTGELPTIKNADITFV